MKRKILFGFLMLLTLVVVTGCGDSVKKETEKKEYGINEVFKYDGLEITVLDGYKIEKISNKYSEFDGKDEVALPITVKNVSSENNYLNTTLLKIFGPKGTEVDSFFVGTDDDLAAAKELQEGASYTKNRYFLYDGDGEYTLEFENWPNDSIRVKLNIKK